MPIDTITAPVTADHKNERYVIRSGAGVSCFGFKNAQEHANHIAQKLGDPRLEVPDADVGTIKAYETYVQAVRAWGSSMRNAETYFGPGVDPDLRKILEGLRRSDHEVRVVFGDPNTGEAWLNFNGGVGRIGRSSGSLRELLLLEGGAPWGEALLCRNVLLVRHMGTSEVVWRHPKWVTPSLKLQLKSAPERSDLRWSVTDQRDTDVAYFDQQGKAAACLAFLQGEAIPPHVFNS